VSTPKTSNANRGYCANAVEYAHTNSLDANDKLIQTRSHRRNTITSRKRRFVMRKGISTINLRLVCCEVHFLHGMLLPCSLCVGCECLPRGPLQNMFIAWLLLANNIRYDVVCHWFNCENIFSDTIRHASHLYVVVAIWKQRVCVVRGKAWFDTRLLPNFNVTKVN